MCEALSAEIKGLAIECRGKVFSAVCAYGGYGMYCAAQDLSTRQ